jgi:outer membrane protein OmpA-like peptidoglycan-associated protein
MWRSEASTQPVSRPAGHRWDRLPGVLRWPGSWQARRAAASPRRLGRWIRFAALCLPALAGCGALPAQPAQRLGAFDFAYEIAGDERARPVQAFDDGAGKTYFQFRPHQAVPVVFVGQGQRLLYPRPEGAFHVVDGVARHYTLVLGAAHAQVVHRSAAGAGSPAMGRAALNPGKALESPPSMALAGESVPVVRPAGQGAQAASGERSPQARRRPEVPGLGGYACPLLGDTLVGLQDAKRDFQVDFPRGSARVMPEAARALAATLRQAAPGSRIQVRASGDAAGGHALAAQRAQAVWKVLVDAGIAADRIDLTIASAPTPPSSGLSASSTRGVRTTAPSSVLWAAGDTRPDAGQPCRSPSSETTSEARPGEGQADAAAAPGMTERPRIWPILGSDETVAGTLARWGRSVDHVVVWEAPWHAPITGDGAIEAPGFEAALTRLIEALRAAGYPARAQIYQDRVVRVFGEE